MSLLCDQALARRILGGEEVALEEFFDSYFRPLSRFALDRLGRDVDAAEEVVQATLSRAVRKLNTYRGEASLMTWLCSFCRHEIGDYLARHQRAGRSVELAEDLPEIRAALESLGALGEGPEAALQREELRRKVWRALDVLPASYGHALEWKYIQGLSVKEVAERLGVGPKAAESTLTRAREAFREAFVLLAPCPEEP